MALRLQSVLITLNYNAIAILHTLQFTVAQALGFSFSIRRLLATTLTTETSTSSHYEIFLSLLLQSPWNADPILRF
jgi:hypothetical protein